MDKCNINEQTCLYNYITVHFLSSVVSDCGAQYMLALIWTHLVSSQVSVLLSLRYLQTAVEGAMALENPEGESVGYLLEKGLKETFEDLKAKALDMLKFAQVDPTDTEASPEDPDAEKADNTTDKAATPTPAS